jgi:PAS domain S-box-containing protein
MVLFLDGNDDDRKAALALLQEHGFNVSLQPDNNRDMTTWPGIARDDLPFAFLRHFVDGILLVDVETVEIIYTNKAFADMLGYSADEIHGLKIWNLDATWSREEIEEMYATRNWAGEHFETRLRRKDGRLLDVAVSHTSMTWNGSEVVFCAIEDISERKKTEHVLHLTRFTMDKSCDQVFWLTPEGRFFYANEAASTGLGYSRSELESMAIWDIDPHVSREKAADYWRQLKEKGSLCFESLHRAKDGRIYPVEVRGNYANFEGKEYSCAFTIDISDRRQREKELHLNQFAVDNSADQAFWITPEGRITYANHAACASLGYTREELVGMSLSDIDPDCDDEMVAESWKILKAEKVRRFERCHKSKDGRIYPVEIRSNYTDFGGRELRFAFVTDISRRKVAEQALRRSEERYRQLMEMLPIAAYTTDNAGRITFFNRKAQELWRREPRLNQDLWCGSFKMFYPDGRPMPHDQCPMALTVRTGEACQGREIMVEHPDGTRSNVVAYPQRLVDAHGRTGEAVNLLVDITVHKNTEEALRESERKYRSIVEHAPFGITRSNRDGKLLSANPALASILKYDSVQELMETVNRSSIQEVLFPEPSARTALVQDIFATDSWYLFNNRLRCKDGSIVTCRVHSRKIFDQNSEANAFESFQENITEQLAAEQALRESEEKFRVLAETSPVAICLYQGEHHVYVNPAMQRLTGYTAGELYRMKFWEWARDDFQEQVRKNGLARLAGKEAPSQYEITYKDKHGSDNCVLISAGVIDYGGRQTGVASLLDITERKRTEELIRASLAEKEVLLREIHHRVKNNLQVVSSLLYLQSQKFSDPELQNCFLESQSRICSMALAHEQLYRSKNLADISIKSYLENLVAQQQEILATPGQDIDCRLDIEDIPLDIQKVVPCGLLTTELLSNAYKHAFPDNRSGKVGISLSWFAGQFELTVADNGVGLPVDFDYRRATTLGLQLVTALVNQLNGSLEVDKDNGTRFVVRFG